jgi:hypothetical protein
MRRFAVWIAVGAFVIFGFLVISRLRAFAVEDAIHGTFYPVVQAIDRYCGDQGCAPKDLHELSAYGLVAIPSSRYVSEVMFSGGQEKQQWRLTLVSDATGCRRLYVAEHGVPLTAAETKILIKRYHHTWSVLQPQNLPNKSRMATAH